MEWTKGEYLLTDDIERLDLDAVCGLLRSTYWAADRSRAVIEKSLRNSVCFSLLRGGRQAGFARAVTDCATFTWICDVVVEPAHRGRGLGRWMIECLLQHPDLQTTSHHLRTDDAHALYEPFGFKRVQSMRRSSRPD